MNDQQYTEGPPPQDGPFPIEVADRLQRLPPYLFGRINAFCTRSGVRATT